jgi:hypothetical protein
VVGSMDENPLELKVEKQALRVGGLTQASRPTGVNVVGKLGVVGEDFSERRNFSNFRWRVDGSFSAEHEETWPSEGLMSIHAVGFDVSRVQPGGAVRYRSVAWVVCPRRIHDESS